MIDILESMLKIMTDKNGSDLYLMPGSPPGIKIDGRMVYLGSKPLGNKEIIEIAKDLLGEDGVYTFNKARESNSAISVPGIGRFRINGYFHKDNISFVLRSIKTSIPRIEDMNLPQKITELSMTSRGLILFVGATGSGKSTSLAAMVGYRNRNHAGHILTIEDPIEFMHENQKSIVSQREVGIDTESYEEALKNALRQAPDVILIGEIRAKETMEHAIAFAETGHLCLSTLHANNANQALDRIINFFPHDRRDQLLMDLSLNMVSIISQRLIPKKGGGRVAAVEILLNTPRVKDMIRKGDISSIKDVMTLSTKMGMCTFDQALANLYFDDKIEYADALQNADSQNDLRLTIKNECLRRGLPDITSKNEDIGTLKVL